MVSTMKIRPIYLIALLALLLTACQSVNAMEVTATPPPVVTGDAAVTVEGKLTPAEYVDLSFNMPGVISEVLVDEGQPVQKDQVIARLDQGPRLASAVAAAELELVNAQQALKALNDTAEVNTSSAAQKVAIARDAVRYAERRLNNLKSGSRGTDVEKAAANVVLLKDRLDKAREDFAPYKNKPEDNVTRATYQSRLADAQRKYDDAVLLLNNLQGTPSDIDLAIAEANLSLAQAQLALAESDYGEVKGGPDPDALQAAQARLNAAETGLTAAQAALSDSELKAPFTGTLVRLDIKAGEQAVPAKPAAVLADLSHWVVETDDLNEMEVPSIQEGQPVQLIPDSLPEMVIDGHVESISQIYEEKYGDVTYTVRIALDEIDPRLRWGMTMKARFGE
jgi:multidrug resistance efflux pump